MRFKKPTFIFLVLVLFQCQKPQITTQEPSFSPVLLKSGKYFPTKGQVVDMSLVKKPSEVRVVLKHQPLPTLPYLQVRRNYIDSIKSTYAKIAPLILDINTLSKPEFNVSEPTLSPVLWQRPIEAKLKYNSYKPYPFSYLTSDEGLRTGYVMCMLEDRFGNIWMGTWGGGISIWDGNMINRFTKSQGLCHNLVYCLFEDKMGNIWIGTGQGLNVWRLGKFWSGTTYQSRINF